MTPTLQLVLCIDFPWKIDHRYCIIEISFWLLAAHQIPCSSWRTEEESTDSCSQRNGTRRETVYSDSPAFIHSILREDIQPSVHIATLFRHDIGDVVHIDIGEIPPQTYVKINLGFLVELSYNENNLRFSIPTSVCPSEAIHKTSLGAKKGSGNDLIYWFFVWLELLMLDNIPLNLEIC